MINDTGNRVVNEDNEYVVRQIKRGDDLNIEVRDALDGYQHMSISGEIDAYTAPQLRRRLLPLTEKEGAVIVVDLAAVDYMDSTALGIFIAALKSCEQYASHLSLTGMTSRVQRLFEITGLQDIMDVEDRKKGRTSW